MKSVRWAALGLVLTAVVAGCKGFWDLPPSTTTTTTTPTTLSSGVFYVLDQTTKEIAAYDISSGTLDNVSGSPYTLSAAPTSIAIAPNGGFLYVATVNGIYVYSIGSGGALTLGNSGDTISGDIPAAMVVNGSWLVDAFTNASGSVQMDAIQINSSTGAYAGPGGAPPDQAFSIANATVKEMVLSPDGANLFLALGLGGTAVVPFASGNSNPLGSKATTIPLANSGGSALSVAVDPSSTPRLFYIGETLANSTGDSGGLRVFNYSSLGSGTLTQATGSPIASGGLAPNAILPLADGDYVYVANGTGTTSAGSIAWFPITASGTTYTVATGSSIASGIQPIGLAEDSQGNFVLAVSTGGSTTSGDPDLEAYTMSSGALTAALTAATGTDPVGALAIAALP
jgi:6-phosphogluconolactonase